MCWLALRLKVFAGDGCFSSLGFGCMMLLGFEYFDYQLQVLILINSSVLCYCVLIGMAKLMGQSINCCTFFRGVLKACYFCICVAGGCLSALVAGLGLSPGELQRVSGRSRRQPERWVKWLPSAILLGSEVARGEL